MATDLSYRSRMWLVNRVIQNFGNKKEALMQTTIERVRAADLKVGDVILVEGYTGPIIDRIVMIEGYGVVYLPPGQLERSDRNPSLPPGPSGQQINGPCLCIRLRQLNTYRARHDMVQRLVNV